MVDKETHCRVRTVQLWKTWKAIKFKNFIFSRPGKAMEFNCWSRKVVENKSYVW